MAELLVWPALLATARPPFAYAGGLRGPGRYGRLGIWGVRIGWLAQTALLVAQARDDRRLPVGHVGRRAEPPLLARRHRVSRLGQQSSLPAARPRGDARRGGAPRARMGGRRHGCRRRPIGAGWALDLHVGLMLAAFASFTVAAAVAGPLPLRGAAAQAPGRTPPSTPASVARGARPPRGTGRPRRSRRCSARASWSGSPVSTPATSISP